MIKLYLDEDVPEAIAIALRLRGYDVLTVRAYRKSIAKVTFKYILRKKQNQYNVVK